MVADIPRHQAALGAMFSPRMGELDEGGVPGGHMLKLARRNLGMGIKVRRKRMV
jgi:hypothetical protein